MTTEDDRKIAEMRALLAEVGYDDVLIVVHNGFPTPVIGCHCPPGEAPPCKVVPPEIAERAVNLWRTHHGLDPVYGSVEITVPMPGDRQ